jgi:hypothetical protein
MFLIAIHIIYTVLFAPPPPFFCSYFFLFYQIIRYRKLLETKSAEDFAEDIENQVE